MNYNEPTNEPTKIEVQPTIPVKNTESTLPPPVNNTSFWSWLKLPSFLTPTPAPTSKTGGKRKSRRLTKKNKKSKSVKSRK
jgi:hypothetical protein